jgi:translation initiation factor IF-2
LAEMAETTVQKLAEMVGTDVDRLLTQMKEAGLPHESAGEEVSDEQKQQLLAYLRKGREGDAEESPSSKVTLKRKSTSTIQTKGSEGKNKTVNVEVRRKRTYKKRSAIEEEERQRQEEEERRQEEERQAEERRKAEEEARRKEEEAEARRKEEEAAARRREDEETMTPEARQEQEEKARQAQEEKAKRLSVPRTGKKVEGDKTQKKETAAQRKKREEEERKQREAEEQRRKQQEEQRKQAEEEAARATAEEAKRVAEELEQRDGDEEQSTSGEQEDQSSIVDQAEEASYRDEERATKKPRRNRRASGGVAHGQMRSSLHKEHGFKSPTEKQTHEVEIPETITVAELAQRMSVKAKELIKQLMKMGEMATVNQHIDQETAVLLTEEMGHTPKAVKGEEEAMEADLAEMIQYDVEPEPRAPVVTVMGHVDHGKTSLLDYIRRTRVASGEAGGITQHIGAYHVRTDQGMVSFLDTPGHAAFTAMRARGAQATDVAVVVVAADDGVMPQTREAIDHAKAAEVPIIIAVNKIDKEDADPDRVKNELAQMDVISEAWGGDHQFVHLSAETGEGIDELLDAIILQADLLELKSAPTGPAQGVVVESRVDKGRGPVTSLLVREGELNRGDTVLAGSCYGRVRAMTDETGAQVDAAGPSIPVEVLGLSGAPDAGEHFLVVSDEKKAREVAEFREARDRELKLQRQQASKLENLFESMGESEASQVNIVLKADVRGSYEALVSSLNELSTDEVKVNIVSGGLGGINESDVNLAMTSGAVLLGFNVRADSAARRVCEREGIDLRYYSVIYELIDDVKAAMSGMLEPERREEILGVAEVREVFRSSRFGSVAGCMVSEGTIYRNRPIRVLRENVVVFEGELESLRRFKEDVNEVRAGVECGIAVKRYRDVQVGDKIEVFEVREVARSL